jgi:hypothetical protein
MKYAYVIYEINVLQIGVILLFMYTFLYTQFPSDNETAYIDFFECFRVRLSAELNTFICFHVSL